jgi:hypothetical protein
MRQFLKRTFVTANDKRIGYLFLIVTLTYASVLLLFYFRVLNYDQVLLWIAWGLLLLSNLPLFRLSSLLIDSENARLKTYLTLPCLLYGVFIGFINVGSLYALFYLVAGLE